jgi:hypothetical protein
VVKMKKVLQAVGHGLRAVIHDPEVQRSERQLAAKILARLALFVPGAAVWIDLIVRALGN